MCFTKLQEQHRSGATASITSFLKKGVSEATKSIHNVPTDSSAASKSGTDVLASQVNFKGFPETPILKKKSGIDSFLKKISPSKETLVHNSNVGVDNLALKKRSLDVCNFDEVKEDSKKYRSASGSTATYLADERIDQDVFSQLPPDIQNEIITERNSSSDRNIMLTDRGFQLESRHYFIKDNCGEYNIDSKDTSNPSGSEEQVPPPESSHLNAEKHCRTDRGHMVQLCDTSSESSKNSGGVTIDPINNNGPPSNEHNCEKIQAKLGFDQSEDGFVPPDIDPAVFRELPPEIKSELLRNWKSKQEFSFSPANRGKRTQPKKQTLFKYFKKK